jgi:acetamidase/formamidase
MAMPSECHEAMPIHRLEPDRFWNVVGGHDPVLKILPGDTLVTKTIDGDGFDERNVMIAGEPNPLTGPVYVEGAEPGDCLSVRIDRIAPNRPRGWTYKYLSPNVLESDFPRLPPEAHGEGRYADWEIDLHRRTVAPVDPEGGALRLKLPLSPMLGCLCTAPPDGQAISTLTSGSYGGNMDYSGIREGATIYLPVYERGALLYLGDGHAAQSDGEIGGVGVEVSMDVEATVDVVKSKKISWPRGENSTCIFTFGNGRPLEDALRSATTEMVRWLMEDYSFTQLSLALLLGQAARYDIGNVCSPAYTIVCKLEKRYLGTAAH